MKYITEFNNYKHDLFIVDVQKSFKKFFTDTYLAKLNEHCNQFTNVYQIWDNHIDKDSDSDYLYDHNPEVPNHPD
jgi:hypothetical protein